MSTLPSAFLARMAALLGDEYPAFLASYDEPYTRGIRFNPLKPCDAVPQGVGDAVPWERSGRYLDLDSPAGKLPPHEAGAYYLQEPSAMLPAAILNPQPGERVLDLCAAPGGKSTQLGTRMAGQGLLVCNEPVLKRAQVLSQNIERMGIPNALVVSAMPDQLARRWPGAFDAVQVDAPCSGEGMFRRHPETRGEWTPESPVGCARRQAEILDSAARLVRPGGRLVYSTCTLNPIENEETVAAFRERHPEFSLRPFHLPGADAPTGMLICYPHRMRGEGHFAALLVRGGPGDNDMLLPPDRSLREPDKAQRQALRDFSPDAPQPTALLGDTLVCLPDCPDLRGLKVLRVGLHLGTLKGKVFRPDHAWAVSACPPDFPRVALDDAQARAYLAGETLPAAGHGWVLAEHAGLPLGWGKVSDGVMKNHYPKELRKILYSCAENV